MPNLLILFLAAFSIGFTDEPRQSGKVIGSGKSPVKIGLTSPQGGWTVDRMVEVAGTLSDNTITPITVSINGDRYLLRVQGGAFKRKFPVSSGKNSVVVEATNQAGTFKEARTVFAKVPTVPVMFVLTSDTDGVYTDLHIYEPSPLVKNPFSDETLKTNVHVFWADTNSPSGGKFYLNEQGGDFDSPGYGPYLYTHSSPPLGIYRVDSNYWPSGDKAHTEATLNVVLFGGTQNEVKRMIRTPLVTNGETRTLAWVRIDKGQKAYVYSPVNDRKPSSHDIWPSWVTDYEPVQRAKGGGGGYGGD
jgi:uncharacterized protein YfaP (DUF2135 family)